MRLLVFLFAASCVTASEDRFAHDEEGTPGWQFERIAPAGADRTSNVSVGRDDALRIVVWEEGNLDKTNNQLFLARKRIGYAERYETLVRVSDAQAKPSVAMANGTIFVTANDSTATKDRSLGLWRLSSVDAAGPRTAFSKRLDVDYGRSDLALYPDGSGLVCTSSTEGKAAERMSCLGFDAEGAWDSSVDWLKGAASDHPDVLVDDELPWRVAYSFRFDGPASRTVAIRFSELRKSLQLSPDERAKDVRLVRVDGVLHAVWAGLAVGDTWQLVHAWCDDGDPSPCIDLDLWQKEVVTKAPFIESPSLVRTGEGSLLMAWTEGPDEVDTNVVVARTCGSSVERWDLGPGTTRRGQPSVVVAGHQVDVGFYSTEIGHEGVVVASKRMSNCEPVSTLSRTGGAGRPSERLFAPPRSSSGSGR